MCCHCRSTRTNCCRGCVHNYGINPSPTSFENGCGLPKKIETLPSRGGRESIQQSMKNGGHSELAAWRVFSCLSLPVWSFSSSTVAPRDRIPGFMPLFLYFILGYWG